MTTINTLSISVLVWLSLWFLLLIIFSMVNLVRSLEQKKSRWLFAVSLVLLLVNYLITQGFYFMIRGDIPDFRVFQALSAAPMAIIIILGLVVTALSVIIYMITYKIKKNAITAFSVKEAIDTLPMGICCYYKSGYIKLKNTEIEKLCAEITGETLTNAKQFWEIITERGTFPNQNDKNTVMIKTPDGNVFSVTRHAIAIESQRLFELVSHSITQEYTLNEALTEKKEELKKYNEQLNTLNRNITDLTIEKELLSAKIKVHDEFGIALLSAKKYLLNPQDNNKNKMIKFWKRNIQLLQSEEQKENQYHNAIHTAKQLGVNVIIDGVLPQDETAFRIIENAISATVSNTIRHAKGDTVYITGADGSITFRNNGAPPTAPIVETGGLKNLRRMTEQAGGKMTVETSPEFQLILAL